MTTGPIRVGIVDDHPVVRDGTAALIGLEPDIQVTAIGRSVDDAASLLASESLDVLLLDVRLADASGLSALAGVVARPAVIILTAFDLPQYSEAAYRLGASGFVLKTAPLAELLDAIRRVAAGGMSFAVRPGPRIPITARELDVLALVADGRSNDEIAAGLGIASATVETHLRRMFQRTGAASRTELATRALKEGWFEIPRDPRA